MFIVTCTIVFFLKQKKGTPKTTFHFYVFCFKNALVSEIVSFFHF
jgi:hypothetical protein